MLARRYDQFVPCGTMRKPVSNRPKALRVCVWILLIDVFIGLHELPVRIYRASRATGTQHFSQRVLIVADCCKAVGYRPRRVGRHEAVRCK